MSPNASLGVGAQEQEHRNGQQHQRAVPGPSNAGGVQQREHPDRKNEQPAQWWLYSDHATLAALRCGRSPGAGGEGLAAAGARVRRLGVQLACKLGRARDGVVRGGELGAQPRSTISDQDTVVCRSTEGGTEVSEAAAKKTRSRWRPRPPRSGADARTGVAGTLRSRPTAGTSRGRSPAAARTSPTWR